MLNELPEDILFAIVLHLGPSDLLSLKQTCRVLHSFGCSDYLWHHTKIDLPLDLPMRGQLKSLSGSQIQRLIMRALRLDYNWRQPTPEIRRLSHITHGDLIVQMQLLGSNWLITLTRSAMLTRLTVWCLRDPSKAYRIASVGVDVLVSRFSAAVLPDSTAIIALIGSNPAHNELLNIYSILLEESPTEEATIIPLLTLRFSVLRPRRKGTFVEVHTSEQLVACTTASFIAGLGAAPEYSILFVNALNGHHILVRTDIGSRLAQPRFRLYPDRLAVAGQLLTNFCVQVYAVPDSIHQQPPSIRSTHLIVEEPNEDERLELLFERQANDVPTSYDLYLCGEPGFSPPPFLSAILFRSLDGLSQGHIQAFQCSFVQDGKQGHNTEWLANHKFPMSRGTSAEIVCLGKTGRRVIWLERKWDTDEFRLMKTTLDPGQPLARVDMLLAKHLALPFRPQACSSLGFDEGSGRVCLGLHTGELYILEL